MILGKRTLIWSIALILILGSVYSSRAKMDVAKVNDASFAPCSDCHLCGQPTAESPCLKECLKAHQSFSPTTYKGLKPGLIQLGEIGGMYNPVSFDHKRHADMTSMANGCVACHHFSPQGQIPPCIECHLEPQSLGQPGLKGVYHRQCLGCHKEWSGSTACIKCHLDDKSDRSSSSFPSSQTIIAQKAVSQPGKILYDIPVKQGAKVTFYHSDHAQRFGLDCADCHQREGCGDCHHLSDAAVVVKSAEEIHSICSDCHSGDNCNLCHGDTEKAPFSHDVDHWRLAQYHSDLPCQSCHESDQRITGLKENCSQCHNDWGPSNFNHRLTGLALDETHVEFDCADCHTDRNYHQSPTCIECHDEDRSPNNTPPGLTVSIQDSEHSMTAKKEVH